MKNKTIALVVAVLAIGLFVLPSVLSLFTGMHSYVEKQDTNCIKCHPAEGAELAASTYHQFGSGGNQACKMCHHKINTPLGEEGHAAVTTPCTFCHGKVPAKLESIHEAHRGFYLNATESSIQKGGNEACVACHTHVAFNYIATPPEGLTYDASTGEFGREPITP